MTSKFRNFHLFHLLTAFEKQELPLDVFLKIYFKSNRSIGSHDRRSLSEKIYTLIRWKGLIDFLSENDTSWEKRVSYLDNFTPETYIDDSSIPLYARVSFPENYFNYLAKELGERQAKEFCLESNYPAPTTIRVNASKITTEALYEKLKNEIPCSLCTQSPFGIQFSRRHNFALLPEFKNGLFEVQDEASQLVALQVKAAPGEHILDYCAGSGGKSLAIAPLMQGKGKLYLHDIRTKVLIEAKKRLKKAEIQNSEIIFPDDPKKGRFYKKMDWVLVDVPCSGSGTLRRNPDQKWNFEENIISTFVQKQRDIFREALHFVKTGGHIVYSTCSVHPAENDKQVATFIENFPLKLVQEPFRSFPKKGGMDGFYAATLQKY